MRTSTLLLGLITSLILITTSQTAIADTWYISPDGSPTGDGTSWATAFDTIQAGIDASTNGDTVELADGTYTGEGNKNLSYNGKAITVHSTSDNPRQCIIDCEEYTCGVYFSEGEDSLSVLEGITIVNASSSLQGGGIYCNASSPTIRNCIISNNSARWGGGCYFYNSDPYIEQCIFVENSASSNGGAIYNIYSNIQVVNCLFSSNETPAFSGAAIRNYCSDLIVISSTFVNNYSTGPGAAIYNSEESSLTMINSILWKNGEDDLLNLSASCSITHSCIRGEWPGEGNINADPMFITPDSILLTPASPCVDTGTHNTSLPLPDRDLDGHTRILDGNEDANPIVDMGAYEFISHADPEIAINTFSFEASTIEGEAAPDDQILLLGSSSLEPITWTISGQPGWLTVSPSSGQSSGERTEVILSVDMTGLSWGVYDAVLTISSPEAHNSPRQIQFRLYITDTLLVPQEYPTIQAAIDVSHNGDIIEIADGTYTGEGNTNLDTQGKTITIRSASQSSSLCVIDCNAEERGFYFHSKETPETIVENLTIQGGNVNSNSIGGEFGGAILCENSSPTISNCVIQDCEAFDGGGLYLTNRSHPILNACRLSNNTATNDGGGCYSHSSYPSIFGCTFEFNSALHGGGLNLAGRSGYGGIPITDSTFRSNIAASGGGMYCYRSDCAMKDCVITDNEADYLGGGLYNDYCAHELTRCAISNNTAGYDGGGLYIEVFNSIRAPISRMTDCTIDSNTSNYGGGFYLRGLLELLDCRITANTAEREGGGIYADMYSSAWITHSLFNGNSAQEGGAIYLYLAETIDITQSIFSNNNARQHGGAIYSYDTHDSLTLTNGTFYGNWANSGSSFANKSYGIIPSFTNCILWDYGNTIKNFWDVCPSLSYCCVRGGHPGVGNIPTNPRFVNPLGPDGIPGTPDDDFRLAPDSPCNNAGYDDGVAPDHFDLDNDGDTTEPIPFDYSGNARFVDRVDMGACENETPDPLEIPTRIYVDDDAAPGGDGSSWESAFTFLQDALDLADTGTEIWVATGTYYPDQRATTPEGTADPRESFWLTDGVHLLGGFLGNESSADQRPRDPNPLVLDPQTDSILNGNIGDPEIIEDNTFSIVRTRMVDSALLSDFTITLGHNPSHYMDYEGGAGMRNYSSSPSVQYCAFIQNRANDIDGGIGGGIANSNSNLDLLSCVFHENRADYGGAIGNIDSTNLLTRNCLFLYDSAHRYGVEIYNHSSSSTHINDIMITDPHGYTASHGWIYSHEGQLTLTNCLLRGNESEKIIYDTLPTVTFSNIQNGASEPWFGQGCIDEDPLFLQSLHIDDPSYVWNYSDFRLQPGSPCIDAGTNETTDDIPVLDAFDNNRLIDGDGDGTTTIDMGIHEYDPDAAPEIVVSATDFFFVSPQGTNDPDTQILSIRNNWPSVMHWEITGQPDWLSVSPATGTSTGENDTVTLNVNAEGMSLGYYTATLTLDSPEADNSPVELHITLHVSATRHVPDDYQTIQDAIDASTNGDAVLLADGTYTGEGNKNLDFNGNSITLRSESGNPWQCIIDCQNDGRGITFYSGGDSHAKVRGISFINGDVVSQEDRNGGAILCVGSSPTIFNCIFSNNAADSGGSISAHYSSISIIQCMFINNWARYDGAISFAYNSEMTFQGCLFDGNYGPYSINAIEILESNSTATNCVFGSDPYQRIGISYQGSFQLTYSTMPGGSQKSWFGTGCIDADPQFLDRDGPDNDPDTWQDNDYRLQATSPCIDSGTNVATTSITQLDIAGNNRIIDGNDDGTTIVDMGVFEFNPDSSPYLEVSQSEFTFYTHDASDDPFEQLLSIRNVGGGTMTWEITGQPQWLSANPSSGSTGTEDTQVSLSVETAGLVSGTYQASLQVSAPGAEQSSVTINVTLRIAERRLVPEEYPTIQSAVDASTNGDIVELADGIYTGVGNRDLDCRYKAITLQSVSGNPYQCIIDCEENGRGIMTKSDEGGCVTISGIGITNGYAVNGGGIHCSGNASLILTNCIIANNTATRGGGLYLTGSCSTHLIQCLLINNYAEAGGGVYCSSTSLNLSNGLFSGNLADNGSNAIELHSNATIENCIFENGQNIVPDDSYNLLLTYSNIQGASQENWFGAGCIDADPHFRDPDGPDNDPSTWPDNNYHLQHNSPCVDAGNNDSVPLDWMDIDGDRNIQEPWPLDLDGNSRFVDIPIMMDTGWGSAPIVDMGVYEFPESGIADFDQDGDIDLADYQLFAECLSGPDIDTPPAGVSQDLFEQADLDDDGDVDFADFYLMQQMF